MQALRAACAAFGLLALGGVMSTNATAAAPSAGARPAPPSGDARCDPRMLRRIPARPAGAPTGREFARRVRDLSGPARDARVTAELLAGNLPSFLRHLVPVTIRGSASRGPGPAVTVCVLPDYLAVGSDSDFLYVPMGLAPALEVARRFGFMLPTPKLVDRIYAASTVKLAPQPLTPGDEMRSTAYVLYHTELIALQRAFDPAPAGALTAGEKKDVVLDPRLWRFPGRVAIYGWHRGQGRPIQPLSTVHGARYADYSHGIRLVSLTVYVNGAKRRLEDVLADRRLAPLLSRDGPLPRTLPAGLAQWAARAGRDRVRWRATP